MIRSRKVLAAIAALAAATTVAACSSSGGGSSDSSGAGTGSPSSAAANAGGTGATAAGTPIKVGIICSCSGPFGGSSSFSGKVAQAWAKSVNDAGGISGHQIEVSFKDDASTPGKAVSAVQSLVADHVAVIYDLSLLEGAWAKIADDAKIPVVGGDITAPVFMQDPNFYPAGGTNDGMVIGDIMVAKQSGAKNLGQLYCAEVPQCQESVKAHKAAGAKYGVPVIYNAAISATAPNYTAQCLAAKQAGVTTLFIGSIGTVYAHVAEDCARQGYHPGYVEVGTGLTTKLASTSVLADSMWMSFPSLPYFANTPAMQKMNTAVDKYYPGLRKDVDWGQSGALGWAGGVLIEKAVALSGAKAGDEVTADTVRKGLDSVKGETLDGLAPPLTFEAGKVHSVKCWFTGRLQGGKLVVVNNGKPSCADESSTS